MEKTKTFLGILIVSLLLGSLLIGCQPAAAEPTEVVKTDVETEEVTTGDTVEESIRPDLVIAVQSINDTHDPTDTWNISIPILTNIYDQLVVRDFGETGLGAVAVPGLAESWEQISDTEWEIKLRQGVKFHNGEEMTAEDVVFTLASEERMAVDWAGMSKSIEKAEVVDKYTVKVTTKYVDAAFVAVLQSYVGKILPSNYYLEVGQDEFGVNPVGTGPYMISEFVPLDHLTLVAFDDYWGGKPPVNSITFTMVPELSSRIAGLLAGEYDIASGIAPDQMKVVDASPDVKIVGGMVDNFTALVFRADHEGKPEANLAFRQAMLYALDRRQITDTLYQGLTEPPKGMQFRSFGDYYNPDFKGIEYDPAMAADLLAESGYAGEEIHIQFLKGYFPVYDQAMEFAQQTWTDLGINVVLDPLESWTLFDYDVASLSSTSFSSDIIDPINLYSHYYDPNSWNVQSGIHTPTAEEIALSDILLSSMDFEERYDAAQKLFASFEEKALVIPFWYQYYAYGMKNEINLMPYSDFGLDFRSDSFSMTVE